MIIKQITKKCKAGRKAGGILCNAGRIIYHILIYPSLR
jgi:hypothetical protein